MKPSAFSPHWSRRKGAGGENQEIEAASATGGETWLTQGIQMALMPSAEDMGVISAEAALLWRPLAAVGGDHCWLLEQDGRYILFMADCTGHGCLELS